MGIDFDNLKKIASSENVDAAAEFAKSHCGDHADEIDAAAERAKVFLSGESCGDEPGDGPAA
ncbi:antitoxin [Amycolatopsis eburnea]|uniref:Antitoxin n=1 Tax=Amycolatopsis eburnea TaxID=2267691 RepID=A0A3R9ERN3_9PSEU|nr:antitoxin [Amycolatopsis eburnea]RSD17153.1 antitoxin [Amycolatopsis eburnea]